MNMTRSPYFGWYIAANNNINKYIVHIFTFVFTFSPPTTMYICTWDIHNHGYGTDRFPHTLQYNTNPTKNHHQQQLADHVGQFVFMEYSLPTRNG